MNLQDTDFLKYLKHLSNLIICVNNIDSDYLGFKASDKIRYQAEFFYGIAFNPIGIFEKYQNEDSAVAEEVLANSLNYFKGLLDDPSIWASDMIGFDYTQQEETKDQEDLEEYVTQNIFTEDKLLDIL